MKVCILTYGCVANKDNEAIIKGLLKDCTFVNESEADVVILNTCIVKGVTQNKVESKIRSIDKKLVITGCMPKAYTERCKELAPNASLLSTQNIKFIKDAIENKIIKVDYRKEKKLGLDKQFQGDASVQISEGCVSECAYCATKLAKGTLYSYPIKEIVSEVKKYNGRVNLTATDTGCYGFDINLTLVDLLKELKDYNVRIGMMNPKHLLKYVNEFVEVMNNSKMFKFAHIPIQSGSNKVLKEMNRGYTVEQFKTLVQKLRTIKGIHIATDIIVGYPTETEDDFKDTIELIKEVKPEVLNVSKFASRKNTKASKLQQLNTKIVKKRSMELNRVYNNISRV